MSSSDGSYVSQYRRGAAPALARKTRREDMKMRKRSASRRDDETDSYSYAISRVDATRRSQIKNLFPHANATTLMPMMEYKPEGRTSWQLE